MGSEIAGTSAAAARRRLAVLTTGRQDYGILRSTLHLLANDARFDVRLYVGGMHLSDQFGRTVDFIRRDDVPIARELSFLAEPPDPIAAAATAVRTVGDALTADRPAALLLVGDRSETLAAGLAAAMACVPIAHVHGGEETEGAIDNACRHALTKLSHLHLVSHERHAARVQQMGEEPGSIVVVGAPGLDNLYRDDLATREELERELGSLEPPVVIVTMHPTTLQEDGRPPEHEAVAAALERVPARYVITNPNADEGGVAIRAFWRRWGADRPGVVCVDALGERRYWGLMRCATVLLGNSSSGLIEGPAAGLHVVNVGDRQRGRLRDADVVIDVPADASVIAAALRQALADVSPRRSSLYPSGPAAPRIVEALARWEPPQPPRKVFQELQ